MSGTPPSPYAGKETLSLRAQPHADDNRDGTIAALWALKMDTFDIARKMGIREGVVANRLAAIRDAAFGATPE